MAEHSTMVTVPGEGVLGDLIKDMETAILAYRGGKVIFKDKVEIPAKPMIGVIGVALPVEGAQWDARTARWKYGLHTTGQGASIYFSAGVEEAYSDVRHARARWAMVRLLFVARKLRVKCV